MPVSKLGRRGAVSLGLLALATACTPPPEPPPRYVVFFTAFSSDLDTAAQGVVQDAATAARNFPTRPVTVAGYTDRVGSPTAEVQLSQRRAQVVADQLVADGVDRGRIILQPRGQDTGGDPGVERRRVEIVVR